MLTHLSINNIVLIERLELACAAGLTALTGETGAGKSILLESLNLVLGGRADAGLIRSGAEKAKITAQFDLKQDHPIASILDDQDIEFDGTLLLRRSLGRDGRSKAFVNDAPVSVGLLRKIGELLVEIHGQFQTYGLLDPKTHINLLDDYAGLKDELTQLRISYEAWQQAVTKLAKLQADYERALREEEYFKDCVEELERLAPQKEEEAQLSEQRKTLMNAEKITSLYAEVLTHISGGYGKGQEGAETPINQACRLLERNGDILGEGVDPMIASMDQALTLLSEVSREIEGKLSDMERGEQSLEQVDDRLHELRGVARKHNVFPDDLPQLLEDLKEKLRLIDNQGFEKDALEKKVEQTRKTYLTKARCISEKRQKAAEALDAAVNDELAPLKLERAKFFTKVVQRSEDDGGPHGLDQVYFEVATNPGQAPGPLNKIASGGELSRFTLALKVVLAGSGAATTMIFDEIDSGVGGATATAIGTRLASLGQSKQVFVVTHSPQVAARAQNHWIVAKTSDASSGETVTDVTPLKEQGEKTEEIARMLSGSEITGEARAAAEKLMLFPQDKKRKTGT